MSRAFIANSDYQVIDRQPVMLTKGETVTITKPDRVWPGWVAVMTSTNRKTHIPGSHLAIDGDTATLLNDFDSTDLCVKQGDKVLSLHEVHGWHWCENQASGEKGWLADYLLKPSQDATSQEDR